MQIHERYFWHALPWKTIDRLINKDRLPHALLLCGIEGLGKQHFAETLANDLLCTDSLQACRQCRKCKWFYANTHPDFYLLKPEEDGGQIKIEQVRKLQQSLFNTKHSDGYQVVIFSLAEALTIAAMNALLKVLEEPPEKTLFMLLTVNEIQVLPTIRSRCQRLHFQPLTKVDMDKYITCQQIKMENTSSLLGAPLRLKAWLEEERQDKRAQIINDFQALLEKEKTPISVAYHWQQYPLNFLCELLITLLLDSVKKLANISKYELINQDFVYLIENLTKKRTGQQFLTMLNSVGELKRTLMNNSHFNKQLSLEKLTIELARDG